MAKMTKTQYKRAYRDIMSKAQKLYFVSHTQQWKMSTADFIAIEKICMKYIKKF